MIRLNEAVPGDPGEPVCPEDYVCPIVDVCLIDADPCAFIDICGLDLH